MISDLKVRNFNKFYIVSEQILINREGWKYFRKRYVFRNVWL